jgi:hypothetical protein
LFSATDLAALDRFLAAKQARHAAAVLGKAVAAATGPPPDEGYLQSLVDLALRSSYPQAGPANDAGDEDEDEDGEVDLDDDDDADEVDSLPWATKMFCAAVAGGQPLPRRVLASLRLLAPGDAVRAQEWSRLVLIHAVDAADVAAAKATAGRSSNSGGGKAAADARRVRRGNAAERRTLSRFPGFAPDGAVERDTQMVPFLRAALALGRTVPAPFQAMLWCAAAADVVLGPARGLHHRVFPYVQLLKTLAATIRDRHEGVDPDDGRLVSCAALQLAARVFITDSPGTQTARAADVDDGRGGKRQRLNGGLTTEVALLSSSLGAVADAYLGAAQLADPADAPFAGGSPALVATLAVATDEAVGTSTTHVAQALTLAAATQCFLAARRRGPSAAVFSGKDLRHRVDEARPALAMLLRTCGLNDSNSSEAVVMRSLTRAHDVVVQCCPDVGPLASLLRREMLAVIGPEPHHTGTTSTAATLAAAVGDALLADVTVERLASPEESNAALATALKALAGVASSAASSSSSSSSSDDNPLTKFLKFIGRK